MISEKNFVKTSARKACIATLTVNINKAGAMKPSIFMKLKKAICICKHISQLFPLLNYLLTF